MKTKSARNVERGIDSACCSNHQTWERRRPAGKFLSPKPRTSPAGRSCSQAFTLIELLVVIAIIGILASMTMVVIAKIREQGRKAEAQREIHALQRHLCISR